MEEDIINPENQKNNSPSPYLIPGAIVLAGILIAGAVFYTNLKSGPGQFGAASVPALGPAVGSPAVVGNLADDDPVLGNPDARVTIVEFGDFQCPFCAQFFKTTEQEIIEKYVKTGKAKFVYRDFPITAIHSEAQKSAEAAECADEQGKFWPYHNILYQRQGELSLQNYKKWALELGLSVKEFNECLDSGEYALEVGKDLQDGQTAGVNGTPTTFVNGRIVQGAVPFAQLAVIIEEELKK